MVFKTSIEENGTSTELWVAVMLRGQGKSENFKGDWEGATSEGGKKIGERGVLTYKGSSATELSMLNCVKY